MGCKIMKADPLVNKENAKNAEAQQTEKASKSKLNRKSQINFIGVENISEKNSRIKKDYMILNPALAKGRVGELRRAIHRKSNMIRAVKIISKADTTREERVYIVKQVEQMMKMNHPNIIKIYEYYQDYRQFYIVSDLYTGGQLFDRIIKNNFLSEKEAAEHMKQILSAVYYCHLNGVILKSLSPENIMYENTDVNTRQLKIIDVGTSLTLKNSTALPKSEDKLTVENISVELDNFTAPYYLAPELIYNKYNEKCDIWSCGVILYVLLVGYPPFNGRNQQLILAKIDRAEVSFNGPEWENIQKVTKDFIKLMLVKDPSKRPNASQCIKHEFIQQFSNVTQEEIQIMKNALTNMKNFELKAILKQATWSFLVNYLTTPEDKAQLLKAFQQLDNDCDGLLSRMELIEAFNKLIPEVDADTTTNQVFQKLGREQFGNIDFTTFINTSMDKNQLLTTDRLLIAFNILDLDGGGTIDMKELKEAFGKNIPNHIWVEIIKEIDENGDGEIDFQEFYQMMHKLA